MIGARETRDSSINYLKINGACMFIRKRTDRYDRIAASTVRSTGIVRYLLSVLVLYVIYTIYTNYNIFTTYLHARKVNCEDGK